MFSHVTLGTRDIRKAVAFYDPLLAGLGLMTDGVGKIPIATVRDRLTNPAVRRRAAEDGITHDLERLNALLATTDADDSSRLEWA